jgi:peptidylglycine monooxygenase
MNLKDKNTDRKQKPQYSTGPVCRGFKQSIIYAWAMDAPKLTLPEDVAFKIGSNTNVKYLVLQVHYANVDNFISE